jgi:hypothetical protein
VNWAAGSWSPGRNRALYETGLTGFMVHERDAARLGLAITEGN